MSILSVTGNLLPFPEVRTAGEVSLQGLASVCRIPSSIKPWRPLLLTPGSFFRLEAGRVQCLQAWGVQPKLSFASLRCCLLGDEAWPRAVLAAGLLWGRHQRLSDLESLGQMVCVCVWPGFWFYLPQCAWSKICLFLKTQGGSLQEASDLLSSFERQEQCFIWHITFKHLPFESILSSASHHTLRGRQGDTSIFSQRGLPPVEIT